MGIGLLVAAIVLSACMSGAWWVQRASGNSGWIDVIWTFSTGAVACGLALLPYGGGLERQWLVAGFAGVWSLRLGWHILLRTRGSGDDPRYRAMIEAWGARAGAMLFWHLQIQALVGLLLGGCVMLAARNPMALGRWQDGLAAAVFIAGIAGETVADGQLRRFKAEPANRGGICAVGLWRWSRHPNYFCEWLCWLVYPLLAVDFGGGYRAGFLAVLAPLCIYGLLTRVSGIPPLEEHMARTRGEAFERYRARTSAFFPWPQKR